jgi:hypothetical protein
MAPETGRFGPMTDFAKLSVVILSVGTPLCHYGVAYHRMPRAESTLTFGDERTLIFGGNIRRSGHFYQVP